MNRKERRAARSTGRSPARAGASSAQLAAELFNTAVMHHHAGALADAERGYRQLLAAFPGHAEAHSRLGAVLMRQGRSADAIAQIERALALQADVFEAYGNLAQAYLAAGQIDRATEAACRALELNETPQTRAMFAQCVAAAQFGSNASRYRRWLARALVEGWTRPRELTRAAIALIKRSATIADAITRVNAVWPQRLAPPDLSDSAIIPALAADDLLCRLLESDPITDLGLERLLTSVRGALLQRASDQACDERLLGFGGGRSAVPPTGKRSNNRPRSRALVDQRARRALTTRIGSSVRRTPSRLCLQPSAPVLHQRIRVCNDRCGDTRRRGTARIVASHARRRQDAARPLAPDHRRLRPAAFARQSRLLANAKLAATLGAADHATDQGAGRGSAHRGRHPCPHRDRRRSLARGAQAIRRKSLSALDPQWNAAGKRRRASHPTR